MKNMRRLLSLLFAIVVTMQATAQNTTIEDHVKQVGRLDSLTMGTIASIVTRPFPGKEDKARAIYTWIAMNIAYDVKTARSGNTNKNTPAEVLLYRKAVGTGFASLFQDMCSSVDIRCLTADGYLKSNATEISDPASEPNHSWAVVQLGQSPDTWYYVDPALASGTTDAAMRTFTPSFSPNYFFADKRIFNWQHYPDNEAWKLGDAARNKKDFYALPVIKAAAYEYGMSRFTPETGKLKVKLDKAASFTLSLNNGSNVSKVELVYGPVKKQKVKEVAFSSSGGVSFSYKFDIEGEYPLMIKLDGKEVLSYMVTAEE